MENCEHPKIAQFEIYQGRSMVFLTGGIKTKNTTPTIFLPPQILFVILPLFLLLSILIFWDHKTYLHILIWLNKFV